MLPHLVLGLWIQASPARDTALVRREVDSLLSSLRRSGCSFLRNGTWHDAPTAADHLQRKRRYMLDHGGIPSAEEFIAKAGTGSSWSGTPYAVRCPDRPVRPSADWLRDRLRALRGN